MAVIWSLNYSGCCCCYFGPYKSLLLKQNNRNSLRGASWVIQKSYIRIFHTRLRQGHFFKSWRRHQDAIETLLRTFQGPKHQEHHTDNTGTYSEVIFHTLKDKKNICSKYYLLTSLICISLLWIYLCVTIEKLKNHRNTKKIIRKKTFNIKMNCIRS